MKTVIPLKKWIFSGALVSALAVNSSINILSHNTVGETNELASTACEAIKDLDPKTEDDFKKIAECTKEMASAREVKAVDKKVVNAKLDIKADKKAEPVEGVVACTGPECKSQLAEMQATLKKQAAEIAELKKGKTVAKDDDKEKKDDKKSDEKTMRDLTKEKLAKIIKSCRDEKGAQKTKCLSTELVDLTEYYKDKDDKTLDKDLMKEFYKKHIESELKDLISLRFSISDEDSLQDHKLGLEIVSKFEKELPSNFDYLRNAVTSSMRNVVADSALEINKMFREAKTTKDASLSLQLNQQGLASQNVLERLVFGNRTSQSAFEKDPGLQKTIMQALTEAIQKENVTKSEASKVFNAGFNTNTVELLKALRMNPTQELPQRLLVLDPETMTISERIFGVSSGNQLRIGSAGDQVVVRRARDGRTGSMAVGDRLNVSNTSTTTRTGVRLQSISNNNSNGNITFGTLGTRTNNGARAPRTPNSN